MAQARVPFWSAALDADECDGVSYPGERWAVLKQLAEWELKREKGMTDYAYSQRLADMLCSKGRLKLHATHRSNPSNPRWSLSVRSPPTTPEPPLADGRPRSLTLPASRP